MNLTGTIESAEKQFKKILEEYFIAVYNEKSLSSHGIDHHRRVWNYSKELLKLVPFKNTINFSHLASELIIACYMHDIGMSVDQGVKHGLYSRNLCIRFLIKNNLAERDFHDALEAIENHDNKDYDNSTFTNDLLTILSVSDDLDAFGFIGIYRYSEIYLSRGIDPDKIGYLVRDNSQKRYNNFIKTFGSQTEIVNKQSERFNILYNFFGKYNEQLPSYHFGTLNPYGHCGVIELFNYMIKNQISLKEIYINSDKYLVDPIISGYFSELEKELDDI